MLNQTVENQLNMYVSNHRNLVGHITEYSDLYISIYIYMYVCIYIYVCMYIYNPVPAPTSSAQYIGPQQPAKPSPMPLPSGVSKQYSDSR